VTSRIEAIVSDFGGVLTTPLFESFARFQESHGVPLETLGRVMQQIAEREGESPLYRLERGELTEADFNAALAEGLCAELGRDVSMDGFADSYFAGLETNHAMVDWLRDARERRGLRLALLTNNVREWEPRWRAMLPVDELFETVVDSAFVGLRKPDPRIYELTLERLGLPAQACAFVDDFEHNCAAAAELGLHAVWFRDTEQAIADLEALLGGPA
jgi:putative hydrolase of the HAD superfamily